MDAGAHADIRCSTDPSFSDPVWFLKIDLLMEIIKNFHLFNALVNHTETNYTFIQKLIVVAGRARGDSGPGPYFKPNYDSLSLGRAQKCFLGPHSSAAKVWSTLPASNTSYDASSAGIEFPARRKPPWTSEQEGEDSVLSGTVSGSKSMCVGSTSDSRKQMWFVGEWGPPSPADLEFATCDVPLSAIRRCLDSLRGANRGGLSAAAEETGS